MGDRADLLGKRGGKEKHQGNHDSNGRNKGAGTNATGGSQKRVPKGDEPRGHNNPAEERARGRGQATHGEP